MAKWDFKIVGASFVKELAPVGDDVNPRSQSFMQPSFDLEGDKIVMKESGQYKTAILFTQIGEIDGVAPTDLEDAYAKLLVLVENFNGGGGAPGTTPNLTQVLTQDDVSIFIQQILEDAVVTIPLEWQVSQVYIYGEPTIGTGGIFLDKTVVFSDNATLRFCWGVQYEDGVFTKTPEPYEFTTDAIVYYNGSTITSLTIQPNDLVMLKSGGIVSPGENIWILTVTNSSNSAVATTGAVISFATPQIYNSIASPSSSNLTDNLTGARIGIVQKIYHNAGTAPTVPAGWVLRGTGAYVTSTLNIIYAEWSVGTTVEYWITQ